MFAPATAIAQSQIFKLEAPKGFEDLSTEHSEQLDLFLDNISLGKVDVVVSPGVLRFADPDAVLALARDLKPAPPLVEALGQTLPANAGLSCEPTPGPNCGRLSPDIAGVILIRAQNRVDLFVAEAFRAPAPTRLPDPDSSAMSIAGGLIANFSASEKYASISIAPRAILGFGRSHVAVAGWLGDQNRLDALYYQRDQVDHVARAGLFEPSQQKFQYTQRFAGIHYGTSLDGRLDRATASDTPIFVEAPSDARVEILRDDTLIGVQRLGAGRTALDTRQLPSGAYPLTLRIRDASGEHIETHIFTRWSGLPPPGPPQYYFEAGAPGRFDYQRAGVMTFGALSARAGVDYRLAGNMAVSAAGSVSDESQVEMSAQFIGRHINANGSVAANDRGGYGGSASVSGSAAPFSWSIDLRAAEAAGPVDLRQASGLDRTYKQATSMIGWSGRRLSFQSGLIWREDNGSSSNFLFANIRRPIYSRGQRRVDLEVNASAGGDNQSFRIGLRLSNAAPRGSTSYTGGADVKIADRQTKVAPVGRLETNRSFGEEALTLRGALQQEPQGASAMLGADIVTGLLRGSVEAQAGERGQRFMFGRAETSFGWSGEHIAFGSSPFTGAGVIVDTPGAGADVRRSLRNGGMSTALRGRDRRVFVSLPSYAMDDLAVEMSGAGVDFDRGIARVLTYPGSVQQIVRPVRSVTAASLRIVDSAGVPVADASLRAAREIAETNGQGWAQLDLAPGAVIRVERSGEVICSLEAPNFPTDQPFVSLGELRCP